MENIDLSIVLPAHNESENLPDLLRDLKSALFQAAIRSEIIVANDGSTDDTEKVLNSLKSEISELSVVKIEKKSGFGNAIIKGLETASGSVLGYMVADGQIQPAALVETYKKLKKDNLAFCKAFRTNRQDGFLRMTMSAVYNLLFRIMFNCSLGDIGGNPKIFTRNFYESADLRSKDFFIEAEIMLKAKRNNFSMGEVPVISLERKRGRSNISLFTSLQYLKNTFSYFLLRKF